MKSIILFSALFIFGNTLFSQTRKIAEGIMITGIVKDKDSGKYIKNAIIRFSATDKTTVSNKKGEFCIPMFSMPDSIFVYQKKYQPIAVPLKTFDLVIELKRKK